MNRPIFYTFLVLYCLLILGACQKSEYNPKMVRFFKRGNEALKQQDYNKAVTLYQQASQYDSSLADLYNNLGIAYFYLEEFPQALQNYERALALDSGFTDALLNRANLFVSQRQWDSALPDMNRLIYLQPDSSQYYFMRARIFLNQENYPASEADLNYLLKVEPQNAIALDSRGYVKMQQGLWESAEQDLREAIRLAPQQDLAWANLGRLQLHQGEILPALATLNKALALRPDETYTLNIRAFAYLLSDSSEAALGDIQQVLQGEKDHPEALRNLGIYQLQNKQRDLAQSNLLKSLKLAPSSWTAYFLGKSYLGSPNTEDQVCDYWRQVAPQDTLLFGPEFLKDCPDNL